MRGLCSLILYPNKILHHTRSICSRMTSKA
jgi:hypothetical protein